MTAYDELQLDTLGDKKTALFLIMSDTDATFNFLISMIYTQLFNLLCEKADDVYGGRLPVHVRCLIDEMANIGQILAQRLNISPHQLSYVTNSGEGEGLLFYGNVILPFIDRFPTDLELYRIMTTKLNEVAQEKEA